jgi:hypothetical protein
LAGSIRNARWRSEPINLVGLNIGHFVQHSDERFPAPARSSLFQPFPGGHLLSKCRGKHVIHRDLLRVGDLPCLPVEIVGIFTLTFITCSLTYQEFGRRQNIDALPLSLKEVSFIVRKNDCGSMESQGP